MKCQQCGVNEANINMAMQMNNEKMQMHLCNSCFREIQDNMMNANGLFQNPFSDSHENDFASNFFQNNGQMKYSLGRESQHV